MAARPLDRLRRHLDSQPIGFPAAPGGVHRRILARLFTDEEALIALFLDWEARRAEDVLERAREGLESPGRTFSAQERAWLSAQDLGSLRGILSAMAAKGAILHRRAGDTWELLPWIIGMFEFQVPRLDRSLYRDTVEYLKHGYGIEFVASGAPQTRVIPVGKAVKAPGSRVLPPAELDSLLQEAEGRIALVPCVCRTGADLEGRPCAWTDRREVCIALRDYADMAAGQGWGRRISLDEARDIAARNLEEGLVIEASNEQKPQFICACCPDCCGPLRMAKATRRAAVVIAASATLRVDEGSCVACGLCVGRCPLGALSLRSRGGRRILLVDGAMCLACGACVRACPRGALSLEARAASTPEDSEALKKAIREGSRPRPIRVLSALGSVLGIPRKGKGKRNV